MIFGLVSTGGKFSRIFGMEGNREDKEMPAMIPLNCHAQSGTFARACNIPMDHGKTAEEGHAHEMSLSP
jgi:hypothetical protein